MPATYMVRNTAEGREGQGHLGVLQVWNLYHGRLQVSDHGRSAEVCRHAGSSRLSKPCGRSSPHVRCASRLTLTEAMRGHKEVVRPCLDVCTTPSRCLYTPDDPGNARTGELPSRDASLRSKASPAYREGHRRCHVAY